MEEIHIGEQIKTVIETRGITVSEFGRRINKTRENVYDIFTRQTIDTGLLYKISEVLNYNFFLVYSEKFQNNNINIDYLIKENNMLKEVVEILKLKIKKKLVG
jgi:hypothetical protein